MYAELVQNLTHHGMVGTPGQVVQINYLEISRLYFVLSHSQAGWISMVKLPSTRVLDNLQKFLSIGGVTKKEVKSYFQLCQTPLQLGAVHL